MNFLLLTGEKYSPASALVLKSPDLTPYFSKLAGWFAVARFIVLVRDPRATIASIISVGNRHRESGQTTALTELNRDMRKLSDHYISYYLDIIENFDALRDRTLTIRYEDVIRQPDATIQGISEFCGIPLTLSNFERDEYWKGETHWTGMKDQAYFDAFWSPYWVKEMTDSRVASYKEQLSADEIAQIEQYCADLARLFEYW